MQSRINPARRDAPLPLISMVATAAFRATNKCSMPLFEKQRCGWDENFGGRLFFAVSSLFHFGFYVSFYIFVMLSIMLC
jgi:hypothetical protein